jgi:hypothetical protein
MMASGNTPDDIGLGRMKSAVIAAFVVALVCGMTVFGGPWVRNEFNGHGPGESDAGYATWIYSLAVLQPVAVLFFPFVRERRRSTQDPSLATIYVRLVTGWCFLNIAGIGYLALWKDYSPPAPAQASSGSKPPMPQNNEDLKKLAKIGPPSQGAKPLAVQQDEQEKEQKAHEEEQKKNREEEARKSQWSSSYPSLIGLLTTIIGVLSALVLYVDLFRVPGPPVSRKRSATGHTNP